MRFLVLERLASEGALLVLILQALLNNPFVSAMSAKLILTEVTLLRVVEDHQTDLAGNHLHLLGDELREADFINREKELIFAPHNLFRFICCHGN